MQLSFRRFLCPIKRTLVALLLLFSIIILPQISLAAERSWVHVHYDPEIPAQTRIHIESAIGVIADMLTEYRLPLGRPVTVVVTADEASYVKALIQFGYSLEKAQQAAKHSAGISLGNRPIILLKGTSALHQRREEAFRILPHEMFHQIQNQFGKQTTATWMVEAAPELFQVLAREKAGIETVQVAIGKTAFRVFAAKSIPSTNQLMSSNYDDFSALARQGYPVYQMSLLMLHHLTREDKFEPVIQYYRLLNSGIKQENAFQSLFRRPQSMFAAEMDQYFANLRKNRPQEK